MAISYNGLWKLLIDNNMNEMDLINEVKLSSGTIMKAENLASTLQVCLDGGVKKVLLPQTSAVDFGTVPAELMSSFSLVFYKSTEDAMFKALGDK
jgi:predicted ATP-dependent Lon-type protease